MEEDEDEHGLELGREEEGDWESRVEGGGWGGGWVKDRTEKGKMEKEGDGKFSFRRNCVLLFFFTILNALTGVCFAHVVLLS